MIVSLISGSSSYVLAGVFYFVYAWIFDSYDSAWRGVYIAVAFFSLVDSILYITKLLLVKSGTLEDQVARSARFEKFWKLSLFGKFGFILTFLTGVCVKVVYWPTSIINLSMMLKGSGQTYQSFQISRTATTSGSLRSTSFLPIIIGSVILVSNIALYFVVFPMGSTPNVETEIVVTAFMFGAFAWLVQAAVVPIEKQVRSYGTRGSAIAKFILVFVLALSSLSIALYTYNRVHLGLQVTYSQVLWDLFTAASFNAEVEAFRKSGWEALRSGNAGGIFTATTKLDFSRFLTMGATVLFVFSFIKRATLPLFFGTGFKRNREENIEYAMRTAFHGHLKQAGQYTIDLPHNHYAKTFLELRLAFKATDFEKALDLASDFVVDYQRHTGIREVPELSLRERWLVTQKHCNVGNELKTELSFMLWSLCHDEIKLIDVLQSFGGLSQKGEPTDVRSAALFLLYKFNAEVEGKAKQGDELVQTKIRALECIASGRPNPIKINFGSKKLTPETITNVALTEFVNALVLHDFTNSVFFKNYPNGEVEDVVGDISFEKLAKVLSRTEELVDFEDVDLVLFDYSLRMVHLRNSEGLLSPEQLALVHSLLKSQNVEEIHRKLVSEIDTHMRHFNAVIAS